MSTNWTDPTGDDYQKYTGEQRPQNGPQDAPPDPYRGPGPTGGNPPPPAAHPGPGGTAYPGQPYSGPGGTAYPGQPYPGYGPQGYGPPAYGPGAGPSSPYASSVPARSGSTITLLIVSILLTFFGCGLGIPSLVMSIIALNKASRDGAGANRILRAGWITFAVLAVLATLFWIMVVGSGMMSNRNGMGSN